MAAKINRTAMQKLTAKAFYTLLKTGLEDNFIYAGVAYIPDSDWQEYTLGYFDSDGYSDSESTFFGGENPEEFDDEDRTFHNKSMYSMHKVYPGGVSRVIPRSDWTYGEVYNAYPEKNNYVLVKEYVSGFARLNVYQCVFSPRTSSQFAPSGTSQDPVTLNDNYVWKYMYTIQQSEAVRFMNSKWMPVAEKVKASEFDSITTSSPRYEQYISQINAEAGAVYSVVVDSDMLIREMDSETGDSDFRVGFDWKTIDLIGTDVAANKPSKTMRVRLNWNEGNKMFTTELLESGSGYLGPVSMRVDSDGEELNGIYATVAPGAGHSSDVPQELESSYIMISCRNVADESSNVVYNGSPYNLLTLHMDPIDAETGQVANSEFYVTCPYVEIDGTNQFVVGDIIRPLDDDGRRVEVIAVSGTFIYFVPTNAKQTNATFADSENICLLNSYKQTIVKKSYKRGITLDSSQTLIADRKPGTITREEGQIEAFNFVLSF